MKKSPVSPWQLRAEALARILDEVGQYVTHTSPVQRAMKKARRVVKFDHASGKLLWAGGDGATYVTHATLEPAPPPIRLTVFVDGRQRERMELLAAMAGIPIEAIVAEAVDVVLAKNAVEPKKRTR